MKLELSPGEVLTLADALDKEASALEKGLHDGTFTLPGLRESARATVDHYRARSIELRREVEEHDQALGAHDL